MLKNLDLNVISRTINKRLSYTLYKNWTLSIFTINSVLEKRPLFIFKSIEGYKAK